MNAIKNVFVAITLLISLTAIANAENAVVQVINIRNEIGNGLRVYIEKGIEQAETDQVDAIIFDVHTPGGALIAARDIIDSIQSTNLPTIAFVNREAISAGAMISLSCDQIIMRRGGAIGDSAPVSIQGEEAGEKAVSYVRGKISATAEETGRNSDLAAAMVDKKLVLVKLENGEIVAYRPDEYADKKDQGEKMEVIAAEGELLTLTANQSLEYGLADAVVDDLDQLLEICLIAEVDNEQIVITREKFNHKLENSSDRLLEIKSLKIAEIREFSVTLADQIVIFLTNPMISSLLFSLGALGLFIEIRSPGFGVPGLLGLICLSLFFGAHMLNQISAQYAMIAFIGGIVLLLIEAFIIPGFGVSGILGLGLIGYSIFFVFNNAYAPDQAITWLSTSILMTIALSILAVYTLPKTKTWQRFILQTAMDSDLGYHSASRENFGDLLDQTGIALTVLRPSGTARIDGRRIDVMTVGDFIDPQDAIRVVGVEGSKVMVEKVEVNENI